MKAIDSLLMRIMNGNVQFVIPVFQRDYSWTEAQCEDLWLDVLRMGEAASDQRHFLGSVVYMPSGDSSAGFTRWLLIDGQQRLTSLTLLAQALRQHLLDTGWTSEDEDAPTARRIEAYFLRNVQEEGRRRAKLVLRRQDQQVLDALLDGLEVPAVDSHVVENYEFFRERMTRVDPRQVYLGMSRLVIVDVTLDPNYDDPQMVFESLNSTGLDLGQADLIRNFILMRLPEAEQTRLYERYWAPIEALFRGADRVFDSFARDAMALRTRSTRQIRTDAIYQEFRTFFREHSREHGLEAALEDLLDSARAYARFLPGREESGAIQRPLRSLRQLAEVAAIVVMRLGECASLSESDFAEAVTLLESYVFRRSVCGMQTRSYWRVFAILAHRIKDDDPLTSLKVALHQQPDSYRFPRDDEFERELMARDLYGMRNCHYMLERLENFGSKEQTDARTYTVEHIMPQNERLSPEWREMLGADWRQVQTTWLHRLGNLTLTGYNSTYSDRPFEEKKTISGGFQESSVRLNRFVRDQPVWSAEQMETRGKALAQRALKVWPPLEVPQEALRKAREEELALLAARRDVQAVPMTERARALFSALRTRILELGRVIEMAEPKSVSYHAGEFFLEILPRKDYLTLLVNLDYNECKDLGDFVKDTSLWKFYKGARYSGGVYCSVFAEQHFDQTIDLVRQAYEEARA